MVTSSSFWDYKTLYIQATGREPPQLRFKNRDGEIKMLSFGDLEIVHLENNLSPNVEGKLFISGMSNLDSSILSI